MNATGSDGDTVLLVDDDPALHEDLADFLLGHGFTLLEATDSTSAIDEFQQNRPWAVFLDLALPEDDVAEILLLLRKESPDTPVILIAQRDEVPASLNGIELDAYKCLPRPISHSAAEHTLRYVRFYARLHEATVAHLRYLERRNVQLDVRLHDLETMDTKLQSENRELLKSVPEPRAKVSGEEGDRQLRAVRAAFDSAGDAIAITDETGHLLYCNRMFDATFGRDATDEEAYDLRHLFANPGVAATMNSNVETLGTFGCEVPMISKGGTEFHALVRANAIVDEETGEQGRLYIFSDITEQEQLRHQAYHDALTGLYSRRHFMELLRQNMSLARRHEHPLSLCLCDLDSFKAINDAHGHPVGDEVLRTFSQVLAEEIREEDVAGRIGGDEFCLIFPYVPADVAAICLERIRKKFASVTFTTEEGATFSASATFGIANMVSKELGADELIELADQSLYKAKEMGRNCTVANGEIYR